MTTWQRRLRLALGVFILLFAAGVYVAMRRQPAPPPPKPVQQIDSKVLSQVSRGTRMAFQGVKIDYTIDYDSIVEYTSDATKIRGVKATLLNREGRDYVITGDLGSVAQDQSSFSITGNVRITASDGLVLTTQEAFYTHGDDIIRAPGRVEFARATMRGSGTGMTYDQKRDILSLADQFEMTDTGQEGELPYEVHAGSSVWARADKNMRFERAVKMVRGSQTLEADVATTYMTADGQHVQMLQLQGNASITGAPSGQESATGTQGPGAKDLTPANPVRSLHARDINLTYAEDGQTLKEAVLAGDGLAEVAPGAGESTTRIAGEFIDFVLEADGTTMRSLAARGANPGSPARLDMAAHSTVPRRVIRAATIQGPAPGKKAARGRGLTTLRFSGNVVYNEAPAPPGKLRTATARTLDLTQQPDFGAIDEAQFSGDVHLKEGTSLDASARNARYDVKAGSFELTGNDDKGGPPFVKDQDQATIRATRILVDPKTRNVSAFGGVQTTIQPPQKRPDGGKARAPGMLSQDRPALAASDELQYDGDAAQAAFKSAVQSKLWQDQGNSIYAVQITVDDVKGDLSAKGTVTTIMRLEQTDSTTQRKERVSTTVSADELAYADASHQATYSGQVQMKGGAQGSMKADKAVLVLTGDGTALDRLDGYTNVELEDEGTPTTGRRKTTGDRLTYTASDQCYKVTGKLVKINEECYGETLCRTLTFYRSVDRMIVDGNAERRTQTKGGQGCKKEPHFD